VNSSSTHSNLRVLMVTPRYLPLMGGIETHVYEVGRRLARANLHITILTTDRTGQLPRDETSEGMQIRRVRAYPASADVYFAPEIYREIVTGTWDVVHCQGIHTFVPPLAMLAALRAHIPFVVTFHTGGHSTSWRNAVRGLQWRALRPLLARAQRLIGVSQFEADLFQQHLHLPREKFTVIPNGGSLPPLPNGAPARNGAALILSVGRLEKYKGHHRVLRAMPHVLESVPNARLLILGTGPYEAALKKLADEYRVAERVEIRAVPAKDRAQMATILASATLIVLLSEYEAHPIAVMEALALGRPVLVADTSGLRELAQRGLVRAIPLNSSPTQIADTILAQLREPLIPPPVQLPTWEECAEALRAVYAGVTKDEG